MNPGVETPLSPPPPLLAEASVAGPGAQGGFRILGGTHSLGDWRPVMLGLVNQDDMLGLSLCAMGGDCTVLSSVCTHVVCNLKDPSGLWTEAELGCGGVGRVEAARVFVQVQVQAGGVGGLMTVVAAGTRHTQVVCALLGEPGGLRADWTVG